METVCAHILAESKCYISVLRKTLKKTPWAAHGQILSLNDHGSYEDQEERIWNTFGYAI